MPEQKPSSGRLVQYVIGQGDEESIASKFGDQFGRTLNKPRVGEAYPAMIVRVFSDECVNLKVELDGEPVFWATSRRYDAGGTSDTPGAPTERSYEGGTWHWPERV